MDLESFWKDQWKLRTHFPNGDVLSTVELPSMIHTREAPQWESCFFYESQESEVVARYDTQEEAIQGHLTLVQKMLLLDHSKGDEDAEFHSEGTAL